MLKNFTLSALLAVCCFVAKAAYVPVSLSGFNLDVVANGVGAPGASSTGALDDASATTGFVFCAQDYNYDGTCAALAAPYYLPNGGLVTSLIPSGPSYQLASYSGSNDLRLINAAPTGSLTFNSPLSAGEIYLLANSGAGVSVVDITVTFTDNTTQVFTGITISDWYGGSNVVVKAARVSRTKTTCGNDGTPSTDTGPNLYQFLLTLNVANQAKQIASISFTKTNTTVVSYTNIMGITVNTPCAVPAAQPTALNLTPSSTSISGNFTAATGNPGGYIVVRYPTGSGITAPVNGTTYAAGSNLGLGKIVSVGSSTSFTTVGLYSGTSYTFYVYAYDPICPGGPAYNTTSPLTATASTPACSGPANVTIPVPGATYSTLTAAINSLATTGVTGPIIIELQSSYLSSNEPSFPITFPLNSCISPTSSLTIRPAAGANGLIIQSSNAGPTLDFNGATNISIDGRPGGTGSMSSNNLQIINTSTTGAAVRFINDASGNSLKYCDIQGVNTSFTTSGLSGVVYFSTANSTNLGGNDNDSLLYCNIHGTTTTTTPAIGIASYGTNTTPGSYNDNCVVSNCNIYDFFHASIQSAAVKLDQGNSAWIITGNSMYQSVSRTYTAGSALKVFHINSNSGSSSTMTPHGSGFVITGNYIGGTAPLAGGSAYTMLGSATTTTHTFIAMDISVGVGATTTVQNNTITNMAFSSGSTASPNWAGISENYGNLGISSNTIGSTTSATGISITKTNSTTAANIYGIRISGGITNSVSNNTIGGITATGSGTIGVGITAINVSGGTTNTISGNTIGSATLPGMLNSISSTSGAQAVIGINVSGGTTNIISNNTIANLNNNYTSTSTAAQVKGISVSSGAATVSGNSIYNLTSTSTNTSAGNSAPVLGIGMSSGSVYTVTGNSIYNLLSSPASAAVNVVGIFTNGTAGVTIAGNSIYALRTTSTSTGSIITGVDLAAGPTTLVNNMITLGLDNTGTSITTPITFRGISKGTGTACNLYYNSIYIGGTGVATTATSRTFAFQRNNQGGADNIINNIFVNARSNSGTGGGTHYAISFGPTTGTGGNITGVNLNYNDYYAPGTGGMMGYTTADVATYTAGWIAGDNYSYNVDPLFVNPTAATPDLHISTASPSYMESTGSPIAGITTDYDANIRFGYPGYTGTGLGVDIGADEFNGTPAVAACSGTPNQGTATGPATVCSGTNFTLSLSGFTSGVGIGIQWYKSLPSQNVWTAITGATNPSLTTSQTASYDYQAVVTCANGGGSAASNTVAVALSSFFTCYCTPSGASSSYGINNFSTTGGIANVSNLASGYSTGGYGDFTATQSVSGTTSTVINFTASYIGTGTYGFAIFIDYNQNGSFADAGETVFNTTAYATSASGSFTIPATAVIGNTRMRIVSNFNSTTPTGQYCNTGINGEFEDYTFSVLPVTTCTGTPTAGTASGPSAACPNTTFTINTTGYAFGNGISYQWESSPGGQASWSAVSGATTTTLSVAGGITLATDYRLVVTCSNGGGSDVTNTVAVAINPFYSCYCTPASNCTNEGLVNVTFDAINNSSTFCNNTSGYTDYSGLGSLATVTQSQVISASITAHINSNPASVGLWIDYNQNGVFDASEYTSLGSAVVAIPTGGTNYVFTGNVIIDQNALTGITRMRVRQANQGGITSTSACTNTGVFGEYEDYLITINPGTPCAGTPAAGTITAPGSVCASTSFNLSSAGYTSGFTGLSYQWQVYNTNTSTWDPAPGTNNGPGYTVTGGITAATSYRFSVTCATSALTDNSAPVTVTLNPATACYCTPSGATATYGINNFSTTGGSTNISNLASGYSTGGYGNFTSQVLTISQTNAASFTASYIGTGTYGFAIFIDYNQNGSFADAGEVVFNTTAYATSASGSFTIPATSTLGTTRMRIVANFSNSNPNAQYCATGINGEFEDYTINIQAPPTCIAPVLTATTSITGSSATINWTASTSNPSSGYNYYYSTTNTAPTATTIPSGSVGAGITTANLTGLTGSTTHYFWVRANCGGGDYSTWAGGSFATLLTNDLPAGAVALTINGGCNTYSNAGGSYATGEPTISCRGTTITQGAIVWFSFVAPTSGFVRASTDGAGTTLDTKLGVFTTSNPSNPSDLTAFSILGCDDDNGITVGTASTVFVSGLIPGTTYYIAVDQYNGTATGSFCVKVDDVTAAMIAPTGSCTASSETPFSREDYTGWATIVDGQGRLIANARRTTPTGTSTVYSYTGTLNVNTAAVRQAGNQYYLDRNYLFAYSQSSPATTFDLKLYFLNSELTALQAVDPAATLGNLNVTRQSGTACVGNYNAASGTNTALLQTSSGTANSISWVQVNNPGFSNFYIMSGASPLLIELTDISAVNEGSRNRITWKTAAEQSGDHFELERSDDGNSFSKLASMGANGTASLYTYIDQSPFQGVNYYRIKMFDAAGKYSYSQVVKATVKLAVGMDITAFPNPANNKVTVKAVGAVGNNGTISLTDLSGKVVKVVPASQVTEINLSDIAQGIYFIRYSDDVNKRVIKITKE
jgi:hypothetical protein